MAAVKWAEPGEIGTWWCGHITLVRLGHLEPKG